MSLLTKFNDLIQFFISGLNELNTELGKDIGNLSIGALCTPSSAGTVNVNVTVPAAGPLNPIAQMFFIMTAKYPSSTFRGFWESHLQNEIRIHTSACLTFNLVYDNVWKPSLSLCCKHVASCRDQTIQLESIDDLFKSVDLQDNLEYELFNLSQGVSLCDMHCKDNGEWVQSACTRIRNYWELCTCKEAAAVLLQLKNAIELKGDFQNVDMLHKGVSAAIVHKVGMYYLTLFLHLQIQNVMKNESLNKITDILVSTGKFLKDIASDNQKRKCITIFQKCVQFRKWLRKVTKGKMSANCHK